MHFLLSLPGVLVLFFAPALAMAQVSVLPNVIDSVVGTSPLTTYLSISYACPASTAGAGACRLAALLLYAVERGRVLIGAVAFITVITAAFTLIIRQSEEALTTAKRMITGVIIGLFLIFTSERFVDALYGGFSIQPGTLITGSTSSIGSSTILTGSTILSEEILGIVRWGETIVAIIAVGLLVLQGIAVLASFGSEQALQKAYRAVTSTVLGLLLIVFDRAIAAVFGFDQMAALPGTPDASIFIVEIFGLVRLLLGFTGIVTIAVMLYAGFLMIFNLGNDELITKAKGIIGNALLGLLLIATAFVIVHFVIMGAGAI